MKSVSIMKCKLVKESDIKYQPISCASDAVNILLALGLSEDADEHFYIICTDTKGNVAGVHEVSHGDLSSAPVHPREVFKRAILNNASGIILSHNHPSGDPTPSDCDRVLTDRLVECGKLLGIRVLDHIIIGGTEYHSFACTGML